MVESNSDAFFIKGIKILRKLGEGGQGVVYLGMDPNGQHVAVKVIEKDESNPAYKGAHKAFLREVEAL